MAFQIWTFPTSKMWGAKMSRSNWWPMTGHRRNLWPPWVRWWSKKLLGIAWYNRVVVWFLMLFDPFYPFWSSDAFTFCLEMGCPWLPMAAPTYGSSGTIVQGFGIQSQHQRSSSAPEPRCGPVLDGLQQLGMYSADRLSESRGPRELARVLW